MQLHILVIGRDQKIVDILDRNINKQEHWKAMAALEDEKAIELFHQHHFDIVLLSSGILETEEKRLRALFTHQDEDILILQHYGGGTGLLETEIKAAEQQLKRNQITIIDNPALK